MARLRGSLPKRRRAKRGDLLAIVVALGQLSLLVQLARGRGRGSAVRNATREGLAFLPGVVPSSTSGASTIDAATHGADGHPAAAHALGASSQILSAATVASPEMLFGGFAPVIFACAAAVVSGVQLLNTAAEEGSSSEGDRWSVRTEVIFLLWACLVGYSFIFAPGNDAAGQLADKALIEKILSTPFDGTVSPLFVAVFNSLGIWPAVYAATLLPASRDQSPVPALPFVAGSFFLGAFALSPYLALRQYRGYGRAEKRSDLDFITKNLLESPFNGLLLFAGGLYLALYGFGNGDMSALSLATAGAAWEGLQPLFGSSMLTHVSCIDFCVLWGFYGPVLLEDGRRRGVFVDASTEDKLLFAGCWAVPVLGPALWLAVRPPLEE